MIIEKTYSGYIVISDIVNGYWLKRMCQGYTKKEAIKLFKEDLENESH